MLTLGMTKRTMMKTLMIGSKYSCIHATENYQELYINIVCNTFRCSYSTKQGTMILTNLYVNVNADPHHMLP